MSFQTSIIEQFQLNTSHAEHCARCFDTTAALNFWIWDPSEDASESYADEDAPTKKFAHLLLVPTPRQRRESLEVQCAQVRDRTFLAVDKCLISAREAEKRCEGLIFLSAQVSPDLTWVELKMNAKRSNPNVQTLEERVIGGAIGQLLNTIQMFKSRAVVNDAQLNRAHIAIPKELMGLYAKSQAIKRLIVMHRKTVKISAGNSLNIQN